MTTYTEVAYINLLDSSSLARLHDDDENERYAIGYQGDDMLHLIPDDVADDLEEQCGGEWTEYEDCEEKNALGKTFHEAIGALVYTFPNVVGCEIVEVDA